MQEPGLDNLKFESITHGRLNYHQVLKEIKSFLLEDSKKQYSLIIGTDSHEDAGTNLNNRNINLVTAILVHRKGTGGKYFWFNKKISNIHSLREKIYAETLLSLEFAHEFIPLLNEVLGDELNYSLEIHIDVGQKGDTRDMIKEVVGMVTGNGYVAKTKPDAYGASYVADKHT